MRGRRGGATPLAALLAGKLPELQGNALYCLSAVVMSI